MRKPESNWTPSEIKNSAPPMPIIARLIACNRLENLKPGNSEMNRAIAALQAPGLRIGIVVDSGIKPRSATKSPVEPIWRNQRADRARIALGFDIGSPFDRRHFQRRLSSDFTVRNRQASVTLT